jgi:hypothetical protein
MQTKIAKGAIIFLAIVVGVLVSRYVRDLINGPEPDQVTRAMAAIAEDLKKDLNVKKDGPFTLTAVRTDNRQIFMTQKAALPASAMKIADIERNVSRGLCSNKQVASLILRGARFIYTYLDQSDQRIGEFTVRACAIDVGSAAQPFSQTKPGASA